jgi:hypothetical protein
MQFLGLDINNSTAIIDHINHNKHDNRVSNLRVTDMSGNLKNRISHKGVQYMYLDKLPVLRDRISTYNEQEVLNIYANKEHSVFYDTTSGRVKVMHISYLCHGQTPLIQRSVNGRNKAIYVNSDKCTYIDDDEVEVLTE